MAWKADPTNSAQQILVHGLTSVDGSGLSADAQGVELVTSTGDAATRVNAANPLPVTVTAPSPLPVVQSGAVAIGRGYSLQRGTLNMVAASATLVTPSGSNRVYVCSYVLVSAAATSVQFQSDTVAPTNLTGAMSLSGTGGLVVVSSDPAMPLLWTDPGKALVLVQGATAQISGHYTYFQAP